MIRDVVESFVDNHGPTIIVIIKQSATRCLAEQYKYKTNTNT